VSAACILGCAGPELTPEERAFFGQVRPWGFILFARNITSADQTRALIAALREAAGDDGALVFVDQEGGRVPWPGPGGRRPCSGPCTVTGPRRPRRRCG
jgi:beta-N-acetylhexosaminidase